MAATSTFWLSQDDTMFELTARADWIPVPAWETDDAGRRRPSAKQATDSTGLPIWEIKVIAHQDAYGRAEEVFLSLRKASASKPTREDLLAKVVAA